MRGALRRGAVVVAGAPADSLEALAADAELAVSGERMGCCPLCLILHCTCLGVSILAPTAVSKGMVL